MPEPRLESTTNAQIHSSAPQNSFLSPERTFNGQMSTNSSNALTAHFSTLYGTTEQNSNDRMPEPRLESTTNAQIHSSAPQNSFLGSESIFNGQMNTISSDDLTAHFSTLYGTTEQNSNDRMPEPRLESTTNAQIRSSAPQNSLLGSESIFNSQMSTNSSNVLTAHFSTLYGTTASPTTTRTPSTAPLHVLPNSPDTASLYLPSPLSSQFQANICLCAAP